MFCDFGRGLIICNCLLLFLLPLYSCANLMIALTACSSSSLGLIGGKLTFPNPSCPCKLNLKFGAFIMDDSEPR